MGINVAFIFEVWTSLVIIVILSLIIKEGTRAVKDFYHIFFGRSIVSFFFALGTVYFIAPIGIMLKLIEILILILNKIDQGLRYIGINFYSKTNQNENKSS
jgi:hypothetical protein